MNGHSALELYLCNSDNFRDSHKPQTSRYANAGEAMTTDDLQHFMESEQGVGVISPPCNHQIPVRI